MTAPAHVVLVGLMGSGKTTVGRRLAYRLGREFTDSDEQIEATTGCSIAEIFASEGEAGFRRVEADVLGELLARPDPMVIAAGGGAVVTPATRALLSGTGVTVVWLDASPAFLASRARAKEHRPLLVGEDPAEVFARLHAERAPLYREVADLVVHVEPFHRGDERPKLALANRIARLLADREAPAERARP